MIEETDGGNTFHLSDFNAFDNLQGDFKIPVEEISCPLLFITIGDDQHIPSYKRMTDMKERIERVGKGHLLETIHLEGAGHKIDAPYLPLCLQTIEGGEPRLHAYALKKVWRKTINWFRSKLNVTETYRVDWLESPNGFVSSRL